MMKLVGDSGVDSEGYSFHEFSRDVKAERLRVSLDAEVSGNFRVGKEVKIGPERLSIGQSPFTVREFTSTTDPDVGSLLTGTASGNIIEGLSFAHIVALIRDNDVNDAFYIMSGGGNYNTDLTADTVVLRAQANGVVSIPAHPTTGASPLCHIDTLGRFFRSTSSIRYKHDVEPLINSDWIYRLTPVTFRANQDNEKYIGFIAEDVAEHQPDAAVLGEDGQIENYDQRAIVAALVKEVHQLREEVDSLKGSVDD